MEFYLIASQIVSFNSESRQAFDSFDRQVPSPSKYSPSPSAVFRSVTSHLSVFNIHVISIKLFCSQWLMLMLMSSSLSTSRPHSRSE